MTVTISFKDKKIQSAAFEGILEGPKLIFWSGLGRSHSIWEGVP